MPESVSTCVAGEKKNLFHLQGWNLANDCCDTCGAVKMLFEKGFWRQQKEIYKCWDAEFCFYIHLLSATMYLHLGKMSVLIIKSKTNLLFLAQMRFLKKFIYFLPHQSGPYMDVAELDARARFQADVQWKPTEIYTQTCMVQSHVNSDIGKSQRSISS